MKYLSNKFLQSFVRFVKATVINGCNYDYEKEQYTNSNKNRFKKESMMILKEIAERMGLHKGSYEVRFNAGGIAVSGDPILHGESIYCNMSQFGHAFYYRSCKSRKDYTGGKNNHMTWDCLLDLEKVAIDFKSVKY